jgi:hypothetical protein
LGEGVVGAPRNARRAVGRAARAARWPLLTATCDERRHRAEVHADDRPIDDIDELVELAAGPPAAYLRYSQAPVADDREGPSVDYEAGVRPPGWAITTMGPSGGPEPPSRGTTAPSAGSGALARAPAAGPQWTREAAGSHDGLPRTGVATTTTSDPGSGGGADHEPHVVGIEPVGWAGPAAPRTGAGDLPRTFRWRPSLDVSRADHLRTTQALLGGFTVRMTVDG